MCRSNKLNSPFWIQETTSKSKPSLYILTFNWFFAFLLALLDCRGIKTGASYQRYVGGALELSEREKHCLFFFFLSWSDMGNWIVCFQLHQPYIAIPELCLPQLLCCTNTCLQSALRGHSTPWLSFEKSKVPAEKYFPRCHVRQPFP